jgi:muramoyltetrapeptide carboxypeptidase
MNSIRPVPLDPDAAIGVVSIAAPEPVSAPEFFDRGIEAIRAAGHEVVLGDHARSQTGYRSGSAEDLAGDIHALFENPAVGAVVCAGGGINANRLTRFLDFDLIARHPKPFVGVSNPTIVLNAVTARTGLITFHGPSVVWDFGGADGMPKDTETMVWELLSCKEDSHTVPESSNWKWLRPGSLAGRLFGGNLTSIQGLLGTPNEPSWDRAVLFWEDIAKPINRLDMMLTHFRDAGVLDKISGMVVGQLVSCEPSDGVDSSAMLLDLLAGHDFPILIDVPFGHTTDKVTIPVGAYLSTAPGQGLTFDLTER